MPATKASPKKPPKKSPRGDLAPERIAAILKALDEAYPNAVCALNHKTPWELLVATILSAQCTDVRVNMVTPELFKRFPTPPPWPRRRSPSSKTSSAPPASSATRPNRSRAPPKPSSRDSTAKSPAPSPNSSPFPARRARPPTSSSASPIGIAEGVVVDTHVFRIAHRLSLAKGDTPPKVEEELMKVIPREKWIDFSHQVIHHGRQVCIARKPKCNICNLEQLCHSKDKTWHS